MGWDGGLLSLHIRQWETVITEKIFFGEGIPHIPPVYGAWRKLSEIMHLCRRNPTIQYFYPNIVRIWHKWGRTHLESTSQFKDSLSLDIKYAPFSKSAFDQNSFNKLETSKNVVMDAFGFTSVCQSLEIYHCLLAGRHVLKIHKCENEKPTSQTNVRTNKEMWNMSFFKKQEVRPLSNSASKKCSAFCEQNKC